MMNTRAWLATAALLLCSACASSATPGPTPAAPSSSTADAKCQTFPTCSASTTCTGTTTCIKTKSCPQALCMSEETACTLQCGAGASCALLESYPAQVACNP